MASILSKIGNTPLLKIKKLASHLKHVSIYAKAEWFNPGGSVKDRPAFYMIMDGKKSGLLSKDKIIIDATSGNTGIAYAMIGSVLGYRVKLAIPKNASVERIRILKAYGAEIIFTDPLEGSDEELKKFAEKELGIKNLEKGIDFLLKIKENFFLGEAKFLTDYGGSQNNQFRDALRVAEIKKHNIIGIAVLDGIVWFESKAKMYKTIKEFEGFALSALLLKEFIEEQLKHG